jgi:CRISP-associated protein Cas1
MSGQRFWIGVADAMLNYAYAVLFSQVKIQLLAKGYDPTIGLAHATGKYREALVLDHMEPLRPVIDGEILDILFAEKLCSADFAITREGICRLNPQFAKIIAQRTMQSAGKYFGSS